MNEYTHILGICLSVVIAIMAYGTYRCKSNSYVDPLTKSMFPHPYNMYFDGWGISHFVLFFVLGYLYPSKIIFIWVLGTIWELLEYSIKDKPFYLSKCNYVIDTDHGAGWWYGRWQDIVMNTAGVFLGVWLKSQK